MAKHSDNDINLNFLRGHDDKTQSIVLNCGQSALYEFVNGKWVRKNIEGTLFVVRRTEAPLFKIIIPNKLPSTDVDVFQETITENYDINLEEPYALCKNADNVINCFWFYNKKTCKQFESTIKSCVQTIKLENEKKTLNANFNKMTLSGQGDAPLMFNPSAISPNFNKMALMTKTDIPQMLNLENNLSPSFNKMPLAAKGGIPQILSLDKNSNSPNFNKMALPVKGEIPQMLSLEDIENDTFNNSVRKQPAKPQGAVCLEDIENDTFNNSARKQQPIKPQPAIDLENLENDTFNHSARKQPVAATKPHGNISLEELKQSMIYLLQNDADFLFAIYETYKSRINQKNNHH